MGLMLSVKNGLKGGVTGSGMAASNKIKTLIARLDDHNGLVRQQARIALVRIGEPAVDALITVLNRRKGYTHWEAAKALSQIGSPKATQALVHALKDDEFSIRWLAAEGVIAVGRDGVVPLLEALRDQPESVRLREGAHHILHDLVNRGAIEGQLREQLRLVLDALNDIEPTVAIPYAVLKALRVWQG
jgi:HEAT repeat protein